MEYTFTADITFTFDGYFGCKSKSTHRMFDNQRMPKDQFLNQVKHQWPDFAEILEKAITWGFEGCIVPPVSMELAPQPSVNITLNFHKEVK